MSKVVGSDPAFSVPEVKGSAFAQLARPAPTKKATAIRQRSVTQILPADGRRSSSASRQPVARTQSPANPRERTAYARKCRPKYRQSLRRLARARPVDVEVQSWRRACNPPFPHRRDYYQSRSPLLAPGAGPSDHIRGLSRATTRSPRSEIG